MGQKGPGLGDQKDPRDQKGPGLRDPRGRKDQKDQWGLGLEGRRNQELGPDQNLDHRWEEVQNPQSG